MAQTASKKRNAFCFAQLQWDGEPAGKDEGFGSPKRVDFADFTSRLLSEPAGKLCYENFHDLIRRAWHSRNDQAFEERLDYSIWN